MILIITLGNHARFVVWGGSIADLFRTLRFAWGGTGYFVFLLFGRKNIFPYLSKLSTTSETFFAKIEKVADGRAAAFLSKIDFHLGAVAPLEISRKFLEGLPPPSVNATFSILGQEAGGFEDWRGG